MLSRLIYDHGYMHEIKLWNVWLLRKLTYEPTHVYIQVFLHACLNTCFDAWLHVLRGACKQLYQAEHLLLLAFPICIIVWSRKLICPKNQQSTYPLQLPVSHEWLVKHIFPLTNSHAPRKMIITWILKKWLSWKHHT